jgi:hypothetical protein
VHKVGWKCYSGELGNIESVQLIHQLIQDGMSQFNQNQPSSVEDTTKSLWFFFDSLMHKTHDGARYNGEYFIILGAKVFFRKPHEIFFHHDWLSFIEDKIVKSIMISLC